MSAKRRPWKILSVSLSLLVIGVILMVNKSPQAHLVGKPYHHLEGSFRNPINSPSAEGDWQDTVSAYTDRIEEGVSGQVYTLAADYVLTPGEVSEGLNRVQGVDALTWLGHASFLIQLNGLNILTDPFLTDYATGLPPFGPKRSTPPALSIEQLPSINIIVISHNHYDHLDASTIEALPDKSEIHVVVPLGLGAFFTERGYSRVTELDWFSRVGVEGVAVTAVPSIHGSARGLFDRNKTLWAGYVLQHKNKKIYFSGDTAYGPVFKQIGQRLRAVDYAIVPIGVFEPRRRMKHVHVNPQEAIKIAQDLSAKTTIGMHWGTIRLSDEAFEEAPKQFRQVAELKGLKQNAIWVLKIGESRPLE